MNILLINPTNVFEPVGNNPVALESSRGSNPPLGLLSIAGYLLQSSNHDVAVLDAAAESLGFSQISTRIAKVSPDIIGFTVMTQTLIDVLRIIEIAKTVSPNARIVLGGPHVHLFPEETISLPGVDCVVIGEGEQTFFELVDAWSQCASLDKIKGLVYKERYEIKHTGYRPLMTDLDQLPFPARHLVDLKLYDSVLMAGEISTTMFTSRGCPYVCSFCDRPHLGTKFRANSAINVVAEIIECVKMGINDFLIYDDTFTVRRQRVLDICEQIIANGLKIRFDIRARVDTVDEEMLVMLKRAGCTGIHYGVEAGTEKILKVLKKGITLEQVEHVFALTREIGIKRLAYFMIGCPSETESDIMSTFHFARQIDPDYLHLTILTPFPGTEIYANALATGVITHDVWRDFARQPNLGFVPPYWSENFSRVELEALLVKGYKMFYNRPSYILSRLREVRSLNELKRKGNAGVRLLLMGTQSRKK